MDDEFDDDTLLDIPDTSLLELERNAFTSTQKPRGPVVNGTVTSRGAPQKQRIQTFGGAGLSRTNVGGRSAWKPPQPRQQQPVNPPQLPVHNALPASAPEPPSSDYGLDDDEGIIDLDGPSTTLPPPSALPTRPRTATTPAPVPARSSRHGSRAPLDAETEAAFAAADAELGAQMPGQWQSAPHLAPKAADASAQYEELRAKVAALEAEQARLKAAEKLARDAAMAKQGEIAIVRSKQEQAVKEYERRIAALQKQYADETAKWKGEVEAGKKERDRMTTDNRFLQHDLAQEVERGKRLTGPAKARATVNGTAGTPRRRQKSTQALGDGFDDDEVRMVSPSRSREKERSKEPTPKVGTKRKRPANDSPLPALSFSGPPAVMNGEQTVSRETSSQSQAAPAAAREDHRFEFMQSLLAHAVIPGQERTVEALAKMHFPSDAKHSLAAQFMDGLSPGTISANADGLQTTAAHTILGLWNRALMERYYKPINLLLDLLRFCLAFEPASTVSQFVGEAVPLCTHCIVKDVEIMHRASTDPAWLATPDGQQHAAVLDDIDIDEMLDFLLELAGAASLSSERIELFWQLIDRETLLAMLNKVLSISQLTTALQILCTSTLETTFGPIAKDEASNAQYLDKSEKEIIDRLTILLFNVPKAPADEPAYNILEILPLRIEVLTVLRALSATDHGSTLLASHRSFIGRLVRFLDRQVNSLYDVPPTFGLDALTLSDTSTPDDEPPPPSAHDLTIRTIALATHLLYHVLHHGDTTQQNFYFLTKLHAVKGGYHKFLTSLTRLAFGEQLVFEHGLGEEVVEAAHTILDEVLSPEEGEAVLKAVETPRGTRGQGVGDVGDGATGVEAEEQGSSTEDEGGGGEGRMEEEPG